MSIKVKVGGSRSIRAAPKQDTTTPIVAQGQYKAVITPDSVTLGVDTVGNYVQVIDAGDGIVVSPDSYSESANLVIRHANTSFAVSTNNSELEFTKNITIDNFGHITGFTDARFNLRHFTGTMNEISAKDITIGNVSFDLGDSKNYITGLSTLGVGELTITQGRITGSDDIVLSPRIGGVVDVNQHRIVNLNDPTDSRDAINRQYLDQTIEDLTISLRVLEDPVDPTDPANKRYVDSVQANVLEKMVVLAATTEDLGATYAQNPFDVLANTNVASTLTIDPQLILNIDGVVDWELGDGLLVKDQTDPIQNGRYELIQVGDGISEWVFQRSIYTNETSEIAGYPVFVTDGDTYRGTGWVAIVADAETFELDSDGITYEQFQGTGIDGRGITLTSGVFDIDYTQTLENIIGKDDNLIITSNVVDVNSTGAIILPEGTSLERPTPSRGMIRFNVTDTQFEGYDGSAWKGLGGVIDVDQDTKILAENSPGSDNDQLKFITGNVERLRIDSDGTLKFGNLLNKVTIDYSTGQTTMASAAVADLTQGRIVYAGSGGELVDSGNLRFDGTTLTVTGNADITGNLTLGGNLRIGDADVDTVTVVADFTSDLIPNATLTYDIGTIGKNWDRIFVSQLKSDTGIVTISETGALRLPIGNILDRPSSPSSGMIRFNTVDERFEGYDGTQWAGLAGSVIDIDQDTKIIAETSASADNDQLDFFTAGIQRMQIDSNGDIKFGSNLNEVIIHYTTGELNVNTKITSNSDLVLEATGDVDVSGTKITNVAEPTSNTDVVTYNYLENGSFARAISVQHDLNTYNFELLENSPTLIIGPGLDTSFTNNSLTIRFENSGATAGRYGNDGFSPRFTIDSFGRIIDVTEVPFQLQSNAILEFEEASQDITAAQFRFATHQGISFVYEDERGTGNIVTEGLISATVDDFIINLTGDVSGSNTVISVSDVTIPVTITTDYVVDVQGEANGSIEVFHTQSAGSTPIIKHGDTSSVADTSISLPDTIQNLTFDEYGHVQTVSTTSLDIRYIPKSGGTFTGNIYAPRYYDSNDSNFFMDPASQSQLNGAYFGYNQSFSQVLFADGAGTSILYATGGKIGFLNNTFNFTAYADKSTSNWVVDGGDVVSRRFVDSNDNSYFVNPAGTDSYLKYLEIETDLDADEINATTQMTVGSNLVITSDRIQNLVSPISGTDAANKSYVDSVAEGLRVIPSALAATTADLNATYDSFNLTLTAPSNGAFSLDGVTTWSVGDRVLVKDQNNASENGAYEVLVVGNVFQRWVLQRGLYFNESHEIPGSFQFVTDGTVNNGTGWVAQVADAETYTLDVDDVSWYQFSGAGSYQPGDGLTLTGTVFSITYPYIGFSAENGIADQVRLGETISFGAGEGINTTVSNNSIVIAGELATNSNIGVASFAPENFTVTAGEVAVSVIDGGTF